MAPDNRKFEELTDKEKIEVLRMEVRDLRFLINRISRLESDFNSFTEHRHDEYGKIIVPFKSQLNNYGLTGAVQSFDRLR